MSINYETSGRNWRPMNSKDLPAVCRISDDHWGPEYYESLEIFQHKLDTCPTGCFVYESRSLPHDTLKSGNVVRGFIMGYPYNSRLIPPFNEEIPDVEVNAFYIHELVLLEPWRKKKAATHIVKKLIQEHPVICLSSIPESVGFWLKLGFQPSGLHCDFGVHLIHF